jgi:bla regulator protein blaR1
MGRKLAVMCMAAALASLSAAAQSFEVVSVKSSDPATPGTQVGLAPGGIFQARGITLKDLMQQAYEVLDFQISGGPGWINTERYEIEGKGNGPAVSEDDLIKMTDEQRNQFRQQMLAKLRSLMADRFQLKVTGTDAPIMYLAYQLSQQVGRPVNDKTELKGNFDFKLTFAPDLADSDGPSIFTAVEEQLGLKLESQRGPVELLVIDSVEHPTSN